jgi:hypothetical protein
VRRHGTERAFPEDVAFRVLKGNQQPEHYRISEFRRGNLEALSALLAQILRLCQKAGMVSLKQVLKSCINPCDAHQNSPMAALFEHLQADRAGRVTSCRTRVVWRYLTPYRRGLGSAPADEG